MGVGAELRGCRRRRLRRHHQGAHHDVSLSHPRLAAADGIADQLQISKQSVHELLTHVERQGYVTREPDPTDGRARIVRLTDRGPALEKTINQLARDSERQIAELLGERRFTQLRLTLEELASKLSDP